MSYFNEVQRSGRRVGRFGVIVGGGCGLLFVLAFAGCCGLEMLASMFDRATSSSTRSSPPVAPVTASKPVEAPATPGAPAVAPEAPALPASDLCASDDEPLPELASAATLRLRAVVGPDRRVRLFGRTNLPDRTTVMLDVQRHGVPGFDGLVRQARATVDGSCFATGPLGPVAGLSLGRYDASAITPVVQPADVAAVLGRNLEHLRGPQVHRSDFGRALDADVAFNVGSDIEALAADRDLAQSRRQLRAELDELLEAGRAMEPRRVAYRSGSLAAARACGAEMHALQARERSARARAETGHALSVYAPFGMLWECVSCSTGAARACATVERERRAYDRGD